MRTGLEQGLQSWIESEIENMVFNHKTDALSHGISCVILGRAGLRDSSSLVAVWLMFLSPNMPGRPCSRLILYFIIVFHCASERVLQATGVHNERPQVPCI